MAHSSKEKIIQPVTWLKRSLDSLFGLVFPPCCLTCGEGTRSAAVLCYACWSKAQTIEEPFCHRCGSPLALLDPHTEDYCPACENIPQHYNQVRAAFIYHETIQHMISAFKYYDRLEGLALMGPALTKAGEDLLEISDWVVPVPMHWQRRVARTYNQSALLAQAVCKQYNRYHQHKVSYQPMVLERHLNTAPQASFTRRHDRQANVQQAFRVNAHYQQKVAGKRIVLIDDVLTTGATLNACADVLRIYQAASVDVLVVARRL